MRNAAPHGWFAVLKNRIAVDDVCDQRVAQHDQLGTYLLVLIKCF